MYDGELGDVSSAKHERHHARWMLPGIFNKLHNGFMVYHFSTTFKEISFCTQVLDLLWKENF